MTALELKNILEQVPDDTEILLPVEHEEGTWKASGDLYVGFCDPDNDRVDGWYIEISYVAGGKVTPPTATNTAVFPVLALCYTGNYPKRCYMED